MSQDQRPYRVVFTNDRNPRWVCIGAPDILFAAVEARQMAGRIMEQRPSADAENWDEWRFVVMSKDEGQLIEPFVRPRG